MGIHSGPVREVKDASGRDNVAGIGINIAQRVMDCGDAATSSSHSMWRMIWQYRQWAPRLRDLGDCESDSTRATLTCSDSTHNCI